MSGARPPAGTPAWYIRDARLPGRRWQVRCIVSDLHEDAEVLEGPIDDGGGFLHSAASLDEDGRLRVALNPILVGGATSMWFVEIEEFAGPRPAISLVGFDNDLRAPGTIISNAEFFSMPLQSHEQAAAVRWYLDGTVDQVFVAPAWRRRGIGSAVLFTADCYHQARGFRGALRSDGRRTAMGETLVAALQFPERIPPLDEVIRPMDPSSQGDAH